jgi:hypothetical protein
VYEKKADENFLYLSSNIFSILIKRENAARKKWLKVFIDGARINILVLSSFADSYIESACTRKQVSYICGFGGELYHNPASGKWGMR